MADPTIREIIPGINSTKSVRVLGYFDFSARGLVRGNLEFYGPNDAENFILAASYLLRGNWPGSINLTMRASGEYFNSTRPIKHFPGEQFVFPRTIGGKRIPGHILNLEGTINRALAEILRAFDKRVQTMPALPSMSDK